MPSVTDIETDQEDDFGFTPEADDFGFTPEEQPAAPQAEATLPPRWDMGYGPEQSEIPMTTEQARDFADTLTPAQAPGLSPEALANTAKNEAIGTGKAPTFKQRLGQAATATREAASPLVGPTEDQQAAGYKPLAGQFEQKGAIPAIWEAINTPLRKTYGVSDEVSEATGPLYWAAKMASEGSTTQKILRGANKGALDLADSIMTPFGIATFGLGALPKALQRIVSGVFAVQMASHVPEQMAQLKDAIDKGDAEGVTRATAGLAGGIGFAGMAGKHALSPGAPATLPRNIEYGAKPAIETGPGGELISQQARATLPASVAAAEATAGNVPRLVPQIKGVTEAPKPTTTEVSDATKTGSVEGNIPGKREGDGPLGPPSEAGSSDGVPPTGGVPTPTREPSVPARPARAEGSNQSLTSPQSQRAQEVFDTPADAKVTYKEGLTNEAIKLGASLTKPEELAHLEDLQKRTLERAAEEKSKLATDPTAMNRYAALAQRKQFFAEAIEAATGAGGSEIKLAIMRKLVPGYKPPFPTQIEPTIKSVPTDSKLIDKAAVVDQPVNKPADVSTETGGLTEPKPAEAVAEPELVGLGGAVPGEFTPSRQGATGIKNEAVDAARQERGEEPLLAPARLSNPVVWDRAMARIDADPAWQDRLIQELSEAPRTLTPEETIALDHRYVDMQNEYGKTARELAAAYEESKEFPNRAEAIPELQARLEKQSNDLFEFEKITQNVGTEWGRSGQIRQRLLNEDYSLARMTIRKRAENEGRQLTKAENDQIARMHDQIAQLSRELAESKAKEGTAGSDAAAKEAIPELIREAQAEDRAARSTGSGRKGATPEEARDRAIAGLKSRVENGATSVELTNIIQKLARAFVRMGVNERVALVDAVHDVVKDIAPGMEWRQTMDAISGYGDFRPLSKDEVSVQLRDLKGQMQQAAKLLDMFQGEPLKRTGPERRTPSDAERRDIQRVNEAKKRFGVRTTDPATQLKSALDSLKTRLRNQISDLEEQLASKTKLVKDRAPVPEDAESHGLKAQRDKLKSEFDEMFGKPEMTDEQRVKLALSSLERQSVEIERQLKQGDIFPVKRQSKTPATVEIEAAKARRDALKLEREFLRESINPKTRLSEEELALKALETRMSNRIAELTDKLARGDFSKKVRKPPPVSERTTQLGYRLEKIKSDFHEGLMKDRIARWSTRKRVFEGAKELVQMTRAFKTSFDLPPMFRQGGFYTFSHPIKSAQAAAVGIRSMGFNRASIRKAVSDAGSKLAEGKVLEAAKAARNAISESGKEIQHGISREISGRPNALNYRRDKLYLSDQAGKLSMNEEAFMSRLATKVPGVGMSERNYTTYLNKIRADSYDALTRSLSRNSTPTPQEGRVIANFVNVMSGRGELGKYDMAAQALTHAFFSPRYFASRLQLLSGQPIWTTKSPYKGTMKARAMVAGEYARALAGLGVVYALAQAAGASIEKDPRSTDFGKLRFGNTRIDPLAGIQQDIVFVARETAGKTKDARGKLVQIRDSGNKKVPFGGTTTEDVAWRFERSKASPLPGMVLDEFKGKDFTGKPLTMQSRIMTAFGPMTMGDIYQAMLEQGIPEGTAMSLFSLFGASMQTYDEKKRTQ